MLFPQTTIILGGRQKYIGFNTSFTKLFTRVINENDNFSKAMIPQSFFIFAP